MGTAAGDQRTGTGAAKPVGTNARPVNAKPCGSWLASDDGGTSAIDVTERTPSLASQLPQGLRWAVREWDGCKSCGSWLASDDGGTGAIDVTERTLSLASQLPQGLRWAVRLRDECKTCGSWLASDDGGTGAIDVTGRTPSLASQLPQGSAVGSEGVGWMQIPCGSEPAREWTQPGFEGAAEDAFASRLAPTGSVFCQVVFGE
jgi:ribosomal protein S27E